MIDNQKGRRNLTDGWKWELAQTRKTILAERGRENLKLSEGRGAIGEKKPLSTIDKPFTEHNTRDELAKELGWSTGKVAMADNEFSGVCHNKLLQTKRDPNKNAAPQKIAERREGFVNS